MTTFVRRPQFEDAFQESFKTWNVQLPSRGGAAMWDGWQPIGFNGPIPIFHDPEQRERELSEAARDVKIQQEAHDTNTSARSDCVLLSETLLFHESFLLRWWDSCNASWVMSFANQSSSLQKV